LKREQFEGYENSISGSRSEIPTENAKRETYALRTPARVLLETDGRISRREVSGSRPDGERARQGDGKKGMSRRRGTMISTRR